MKYFPLFLDLRNRKILVVGNGPETVGKVAQLVETGADINFVSEEPLPEILEMAEKGEIYYLQKRFEGNDLDDVWLVVGTSEDKALNAEIVRSAEERNVFYNIVDVKNLCAFIYPALVRRGDLTIAISTSGNSPALAQKVKREINRTIGEEYTVLNQLLGESRSKVLDKIKDKEVRRKIFHDLVESDLLDLIADEKQHLAEQKMNEIINSAITEIKINH